MIVIHPDCDVRTYCIVCPCILGEITQSRPELQPGGVAAEPRTFTPVRTPAVTCTTHNFPNVRHQINREVKERRRTRMIAAQRLRSFDNMYMRHAKKHCTTQQPTVPMIGMRNHSFVMM